MDQRLIMTKGLPASGKSTWAKGVCDLDPNVVRVNKDDIRKEHLRGEWTRAKEKEIVIPTRDRLIHAALMDGKTVIVDDTNLEPIHEKFLKTMAIVHNVPFEKKTFHVSVEEAIARDALRGSESVGEKVIKDMARRHMGFAEPLISPVGTLEEDEHQGEWAIICDLDGTLALFCQNPKSECTCHLNHRSPYDASSAVQDVVNWPVWNIITSCSEHIIFMSGREEKYREQTIAFLENDTADGCSLESKDYTLYMRRTGDMRKDSVVKAELFEKHVRYNYNILFVLDDRDQVVELWRSIGLTCLQVAPGDF